MPVSILVVDDEPSIVDTISAIFQAAGYRAVSAYTGDQAIALAAESCPNVLLCDVMMPRVNGFEVALRIKKLCPACRVLLFSGQVAASVLLPEFTHVFAENGYRFELLAKPVSPALLLDKVRQVLQSSS